MPSGPGGGAAYAAPAGAYVDLHARGAPRPTRRAAAKRAPRPHAASEAAAAALAHVGWGHAPMPAPTPPPQPPAAAYPGYHRQYQYHEPAPPPPPYGSSDGYESWGHPQNPPPPQQQQQQQQQWGSGPPEESPPPTASRQNWQPPVVPPEAPPARHVRESPPPHPAPPPGAVATPAARGGSPGSPATVLRKTKRKMFINARLCFVLATRKRVYNGQEVADLHLASDLDTVTYSLAYRLKAKPDAKAKRPDGLPVEPLVSTQTTSDGTACTPAQPLSSAGPSVYSATYPHGQSPYCATPYQVPPPEAGGGVRARTHRVESPQARAPPPDDFCIINGRLCRVLQRIKRLLDGSDGVKIVHDDWTVKLVSPQPDLTKHASGKHRPAAAAAAAAGEEPVGFVGHRVTPREKRKAWMATKHFVPSSGHPERRAVTPELMIPPYSAKRHRAPRKNGSTATSRRAGGAEPRRSDSFLRGWETTGDASQDSAVGPPVPPPEKRPARRAAPRRAAPRPAPPPPPPPPRHDVDAEVYTEDHGGLLFSGLLQGAMAGPHMAYQADTSMTHVHHVAAPPPAAAPILPPHPPHTPPCVPSDTPPPEPALPAPTRPSSPPDLHRPRGWGAPAYPAGMQVAEEVAPPVEVEAAEPEDAPVTAGQLMAAFEGDAKDMYDEEDEAGHAEVAPGAPPSSPPPGAGGELTCGTTSASHRTPVAAYAMLALHRVARGYLARKNLARWWVRLAAVREADAAPTSPPRGRDEGPPEQGAVDTGLKLDEISLGSPDPCSPHSQRAEAEAEGGVDEAAAGYSDYIASFMEDLVVEAERKSRHRIYAQWGAWFSRYGPAQPDKHLYQLVLAATPLQAANPPAVPRHVRGPEVAHPEQRPEGAFGVLAREHPLKALACLRRAHLPPPPPPGGDADRCTDEFCRLIAAVRCPLPPSGTARRCAPTPPPPEDPGPRARNPRTSPTAIAHAVPMQEQCLSQIAASTGGSPRSADGGPIHMTLLPQPRQSETPRMVAVSPGGAATPLPPDGWGGPVSPELTETPMQLTAAGYAPRYPGVISQLSSPRTHGDTWCEDSLTPSVLPCSGQPIKQLDAILAHLDLDGSP